MLVPSGFAGPALSTACGDFPEPAVPIGVKLVVDFDCMQQQASQHVGRRLTCAHAMCLEMVENLAVHLDGFHKGPPSDAMEP